MNWDKNFSKIVKETESNLAKVKERLSVAQISESLPELHTAALKSHTHSLGDGGGFSSLRTPAATSYNDFTKDVGTKNDIRSDGPVLMTTEQSSMVTLLHDKIDAQEKTIQVLIQSVKRLEDEREHYMRQVKELREDLAALHSRVVERGIDLQTERKMDQWRQEVAAQMASLQSQVSHSKRNEENNSTYHGGQTAGIVRDIHELKRFVATECDGLRYNIEGVKTRIGRMESGVHSSGSTSRGFGQAPQPADPFKAQTHQPYMNVHQPTAQQSESLNADIPYLKGSIHSIRERLHNVESDIRLATSSTMTGMPRTTTNPTPKMSRSKNAKSSYLDDLGLNDSMDDGDRLHVGDLSLDELNDSGDGLLDETGSIDLEDVHTANTIDLNLSEDPASDLDDDDPSNDHELSIDDLS